MYITRLMQLSRARGPVKQPVRGNGVKKSADLSFHQGGLTRSYCHTFSLDMDGVCDELFGFESQSLRGCCAASDSTMLFAPVRLDEKTRPAYDEI